MIVEPKVREYVCTTAHPQGCAQSVRRQIEYVKNKGEIAGVKKVLVIGCSTGYGLASRITAAFGCHAATLGVMFERPAAGKRTATAGWYNTAAFEKEAEKEGIYAKTINGDAFSVEVKEQAVAMIREDLGKVDLVVYSLAAPRRTLGDGTVISSCLKTTDRDFTEKSLDLRTGEVIEKTIPAASQEEVEGTIKVMGGEDWKEWILTLKEAGVLSDGAKTVAYSYIGPKMTYPIYAEGTIGQAKKHLQKTAEEINEQIPGVTACISVNKALVTQASSAIPIVPLYFSILYKCMKENGTHEGCIEQMQRLFADKLLRDDMPVDEEGRIRMDDKEMDHAVQAAVEEIWRRVNTQNLKELTDVEGYWEDFYHMFGFHYSNVDYAQDVNTDVEIPSLT
ncbi:MAG: enoyl-ACP reductase FabV [Blautia sp.]|jgi:enoyl-[acyl-carrier protein] reductase/trans-2-enoyl-CoA reductase (NAD+)